MAARKIGSHSARSGRSREWNITARLVPPRMNTAGRDNSDMGASSVGRRIASGGIWVKLDVTREHGHDIAIRLVGSLRAAVRRAAVAAVRRAHRVDPAR